MTVLPDRAQLLVVHEQLTAHGRQPEELSGNPPSFTQNLLDAPTAPSSIISEPVDRPRRARQA